ncbi:MAG: universal stress protein [Desulfobacter sp.]|nr:universal stress protein [Desulfobacter sp.]
MIQKIKRILFASDLSYDMKEVFEHAVSYATYSGAEIIVLHVMEEASKNSKKRVRMAFGETLYQNIKNEHKSGAHDLLTGKNVDALRIRQAIMGFFSNGEPDKMPEQEASPIEKILVTESLSVAGEISRTAVEEKCDAIVIGCKQQGLLAKAMGDHVLRKVLKQTSVPVLIVPLAKK